LTSSFTRLSINLVRRTKRSACSSWTPLATWQSARRLDAIKACAWPAWITPNAYDVERRLGVERLPGELPEEPRSASFQPAPVKKRPISSAAARCAGWGSRRFATRVVQVAPKLVQESSSEADI
jgi:hypothetical protein